MKILERPVITEKSMTKIAEGSYTFKVFPRANKAQIASFIEDMYKVNVTKVNIINKKDEKKLVRGRFLARKRGWKKAVVTIKKGQKIPGFEEK